ncbi:ALK tyrosine kinase receptor-like, partial [Salvelinus fontinalis]|uniref:ALK tyrosine kinase receptor-like n=1 Tax=Salvelinus fontinalis TaxID=8038 RepID=UPI002485947E
DPDVVTVPLPVEYGPLPEEEERVPMRPEDPTASPLLASTLTPDDAGPAPSAPKPTGATEAQQPQPFTMTTATSKVPPPIFTQQPNPDGGHVNLAFTQGHPGDKEGRNGKPTNLWNPTYGSWFLQLQQQKKQQHQQQPQQQQQQLQQKQERAGSGGGGVGGGRVPGEGQEHKGRTVGESVGALSLQHQQQFQPPYPFHPQQQQQMQLLHHQQQQQQGFCRPLLPPPPPPQATSLGTTDPTPSPLLLDSAALPPVPLFRLRRFPCGNIGYGYQDQGLPLEAAHHHQNPASVYPPPPPPPPPPPVAPQRGVAGTQLSLSHSTMAKSEDSLPLLVTMGTVQDPSLPRMEGHNATVL